MSFCYYFCSSCFKSCSCVIVNFIDVLLDWRSMHLLLFSLARDLHCLVLLNYFFAIPPYGKRKYIVPPLAINKTIICENCVSIPVPPGSYTPLLTLHRAPLRGTPHYLRNAGLWQIELPLFLNCQYIMASMYHFPLSYVVQDSIKVFTH